MNVKEPEIKVDHIYHNKFDNRKSQLRLVDNNQNQYNQLMSKNNTSGCKGVYWHKKTKKWESLIGYKGKILYLGLYDNFEDAVKARKEAEVKYFGEYCYREDSNPIDINT